MARGLTPKQERFLEAYLSNGLNAKQAAIAAGYAKGSAEIEGSRLLRSAKVSAEIAKRTHKASQKVSQRIDISVERVLDEVGKLAFFDPKDLFEDDGSLKRINDIPAHTRSVISGLEVSEIFEGQGDQQHAIGLLKKVKLSDRRAALDMLMRYHSLYKDKLEVNVSEELAQALSNARKRIGR